MYIYIHAYFYILHIYMYICADAICIYTVVYAYIYICIHVKKSLYVPSQQNDGWSVPIAPGLHGCRVLGLRA